MNIQRDFEGFLRDIRACKLCEELLPLGAKPIVRASSNCRLLIIGQAPGNRVHQTEIPFNDPSGDRLRTWLNIDRATFYDDSRIAIIPMGFCYPGKNPKGGDNPPRPECAQHWHKKIMENLPFIEFTLLVGRYSQLYYLGKKAKSSGTETILAWKEYLLILVGVIMRGLKRTPGLIRRSCLIYGNVCTKSFKNHQAESIGSKGMFG